MAGVVVGRSIPEIEKALYKLVENWGTYSGTERGGAQSFLNELIDAYSGEGSAMASGCNRRIKRLTPSLHSTPSLA